MTRPDPPSLPLQLSGMQSDLGLRRRLVPSRHLVLLCRWQPGGVQDSKQEPEGGPGVLGGAGDLAGSLRGPAPLTCDHAPIQPRAKHTRPAENKQVEIRTTSRATRGLPPFMEDPRRKKRPETTWRGLTE